MTKQEADVIEVAQEVVKAWLTPDYLNIQLPIALGLLAKRVGALKHREEYIHG